MTGLFPLPRKIKKIIIGTGFFLSALIIAFSFFGHSGIAGEYLKNFFIYIVGTAVFTVPLILLLSGLIVFKTRYKRFALPAVISSFLVVFGIAGIFEILSSEKNPFGVINGVNEGGLAGRIFGGPLLGLFDFWIAAFVLSASVIAGSLIFFQLLRVPSVLKEEEDVVKDPLAARIFRKIIGKESEFTVDKVGHAEEFKEIKKQIEKREEKTEEKVKPKSREKEEFESKFPPFDLLESDKGIPSSGDTKVNSAIIRKTLENFDIPVEMSEVKVGPTVAQYTLKPSEGIKLSRITSLSNDLSLALAAHSIRIEAPIPGRSLVGVEIPNRIRAEVRLRNLMDNPEYSNSSFRLPLVMGKDVSGDNIYSRIEKMPHLLVAGSTGSGKTIFLNTLILSLLFRNTPKTLRLILVDPKRVEFSNYEELPHLLCPVIFDINRTCNALKWLVGEMERRLKVMSEAKARDIGSYNEIVAKNDKKKNAEEMEVMPYIVIIVDELADLMVSKGKDIEAGIVRLAQMARAAGIHLVLATQRPSVEVITGLIKANIISRVAFQVASQVDSRTILDTAGAEKLLGAGDMLFVNGEMSKPKRIQAPYVSEDEIRDIVKWIRSEYGDPKEDDDLSSDLEKGLEVVTEESLNFSEGEDDPLYEEAKNLVVESKKASASFLQRRLRIGYARAARLIDMMEERGVVGPGEGAKPREIYVNNGEDDNGDKWHKI